MGHPCSQISIKSPNDKFLENFKKKFPDLETPILIACSDGRTYSIDALEQCVAEPQPCVCFIFASWVGRLQHHWNALRKHASHQLGGHLCFFSVSFDCGLVSKTRLLPGLCCEQSVRGADWTRLATRTWSA